jgi:hypothetical protein
VAHPLRWFLAKVDVAQNPRRRLQCEIEKDAETSSVVDFIFVHKAVDCQSFAFEQFESMWILAGAL